MFPHLKIALGGQRFSSNEEVITFANNYFAEKKRRVLFGRVTEMGTSLGEVCNETMLKNFKRFLKKCLIPLLGRKLFRPLSYVILRSSNTHVLSTVASNSLGFVFILSTHDIFGKHYALLDICFNKLYVHVSVEYLVNCNANADSKCTPFSN